ncbi:unnamed protein product [Prorocentrum cordatum]|uniref:Altered inheritance of mitochondria protein 24, mitochondrial n=1 Tax=Prorocentrum cordatum TaxID=2364126 RepID=A0ABN9U2X4_9DINO|nr:unnamed protein product [Polarella glacialis]
MSEIVLTSPSCTAVGSVSLRMRMQPTWYRGDAMLLEPRGASYQPVESISPPTITPGMGYHWSTTTSCDDSCVALTGTPAAAPGPMPRCGRRRLWGFRRKAGEHVMINIPRDRFACRPMRADRVDTAQTCTSSGSARRGLAGGYHYSVLHVSPRLQDGLLLVRSS